MIFQGTGISGAFVIELEPRADSRGLLARAYSFIEMLMRRWEALAADELLLEARK